jgi:hypothetical protein
MVSGTHLGLLLDSCGFVDLWRPLWREDGCVVYNCFYTSPAQSFLGPSPEGLIIIFYCLKFETLPTWRKVPLLISPRNGVAQLYFKALGCQSSSQNQSQNCITIVGQSASLAWCQAPIRDPRQAIPFFLKLFVHSYGFVYVTRPLWREVGSVVFTCCWASSVQSISGPAGMITIF